MVDSSRIVANDNRRQKAVSAPLNKAALLGRLGGDPEIRVTRCGGQTVHFSLATCERPDDLASDAFWEPIEWHRVVVFDQGLAMIAGACLAKGCEVYVEGQLQTRRSSDQAGNPQITTEIVLSGAHARLDLINEQGAIAD